MITLTTSECENVFAEKLIKMGFQVPMEMAKECQIFASPAVNLLFSDYRFFWVEQ